MLFMPEWFRKAIRKYGEFLFGREPRIHRIPFGPLKGRKIFTRFGISPRMFFGVDEPWIAQLIQEYVRQGDVIYDIGAHIGYTCLLFAQRLKGSGSVLAFEILSSTATFLRKTIEANDFTNITIHNVGLSATDGTLDLPVGDTLMTSIYSARVKGLKFESCKLVSLDGYVLREGLPSPSLIKIDIEGAEVACLIGGKELIGKVFPRMIIEFHNLDLLKQGFSLLDQLGYRMHLRTGDIVSQKMLARMNQFLESVLCLPDKS